MRSKAPQSAIVTSSGPRRLSTLWRLASEWNGWLEACLRDPDQEPVHRVRTGSRRLEAFLELSLPADGAKQLSPEARLYLRGLKKLRRAAAPVRDLDVHRKLLELYAGVGRKGKDLHHKGESSEMEREAAAPEWEARLSRQARELDEWLKQRRERLATRLQKKIGKRRAESDGQLAALEAELPAKPRSAPGAGAKEALAAFSRAVKRFPRLSAGNLHEFRKATKKARYVAELAPRSREAGETAAKLKAIQDAIGEWHDWLCLADEARHALGRQGRELAVRLDGKVQQSFDAALKQVAEGKRHLLGTGGKKSA